MYRVSGAEMTPGKEETSEIRGQVPGIRGRNDPGKEEASGIRGQVPGIRKRNDPGKNKLKMKKGIFYGKDTKRGFWIY